MQFASSTRSTFKVTLSSTYGKNLKDQPDLALLSKQTGGLFIYATTTVRFISPPNFSEMCSSLQVMLNSGSLASRPPTRIHADVRCTIPMFIPLSNQVHSTNHQNSSKNPPADGQTHGTNGNASRMTSKIVSLACPVAVTKTNVKVDSL